VRVRFDRDLDLVGSVMVGGASIGSLFAVRARLFWPVVRRGGVRRASASVGVRRGVRAYASHHDGDGEICAAVAEGGSWKRARRACGRGSLLAGP